MHSLRVPAVVLGLVVSCLAVVLWLAPAFASPNGVVISEFRFRGPAGGNDEFVELKNTSADTVDISDYRLQGCSASTTATPSTRATVPAGTAIAPGGSYLFTNNGSSGYSGTVTGDQNYSTGVGDGGGLVLGDAGNGVIDRVGATATSEACREGVGIAGIPTSNGDNSYERRVGGTQDTDDNAADFEGPKAGNPHNSGGDTAACSDGADNDNDGKIDFEGANPDPGCFSANDDDEADPPVTKISAVQGAGASSPLSGDTVTIEGVVTGIDDEIGASFGSNNSINRFPEDAGIFVQEEAADEDADPNTSEGVFVGYVRDRRAYQPGDVVRINGEVSEKFGQTQINETVNQEPAKTGTAPVPAPVAIDEARAEGQEAPARPYYESLEGMRVGLDTGVANSGGTNKFGELFLTPGPEKDRVFREEVVPALMAADSDAGAGDPDNPYRDPDGSTTEVNGDLFDTVSGTVGPLAYGFENYRVMVQPDQLPTVADTGVAYPYSRIQPRAPDQARIASFNVENFFPEGAALDGGTVTQEESDEKRDRIADAIDRLLKRPDVIALQEVDNKVLLGSLAAALNEGRPAEEQYTGYLEEGNDARGIDVALLVKGTATATDVRQLGKDATYPGTERCSDVDGGLFDRPPLAADIEIGGLSFTIFSNHFSSKAAPDACRDAQAAFVRDRVEEIERSGGQAVVVGDLNAFETESPLQVLQGDQSTLTNLWEKAPRGEAYSFQFQGRLQTLDHALITDGLEPKVEDFLYAHIDNDYYERVTQPGPEIEPTAPGEPDGHKVSDHDPPVLTLDATVPDGAAPETTITSSPSGAEDEDSVTFEFASSEEGSTFECSLDGAEFEDCTSPEGYSDLRDGSHTFRVRATDAAGNADGTPAERTWTVDTVAPVVNPLSPDPGSTTRDRTPAIRATAKDAQSDLKKSDLALYLDGREVVAFGYDRDAGRITYTPDRKLAYGSHAVRLVARDAAGNATSERWSFRVVR